MENCFDDGFGVCPVCHKTDGYVNAGSRQHFYCEAHKRAWYAGSNLLEDWRDESEDEQRGIWGHLGIETDRP